MGRLHLNAVAYQIDIQHTCICANSMQELADGLAGRATDTYKDFVQETTGIVSGVHQMVRLLKL